MALAPDSGVQSLIAALVGTGTQQIGVASPAAPGPFTTEGPQLYQQAFAQNKPFAKKGSYTTTLTPAEEHAFRQWVSANRVPFDPTAKVSDYDMRGYFKAHLGLPPWKPGQHFPDTFKTPYDTSFSRESQYATANNPFAWKGDNLVDSRTGRVVFGLPPTRKTRTR